MLSKEKSSTIFLSLWYDSTWDWTQVSLMIMLMSGRMQVANSVWFRRRHCCWKWVFSSAAAAATADATVCLYLPYWCHCSVESLVQMWRKVWHPYQTGSRFSFIRQPLPRTDALLLQVIAGSTVSLLVTLSGWVTNWLSSSLSPAFLPVCLSCCLIYI